MSLHTEYTPEESGRLIAEVECHAKAKALREAAEDIPPAYLRNYWPSAWLARRADRIEADGEAHRTAAPDAEGPPA